jgi:type IV pilus assembly protein PilA
LYKKTGFTLIELIIVIAIIGILAAVASPMMTRTKGMAIATEAVAGLATIRQALREYYVENGTYPRYGGGAAYVQIFGFGQALFGALKLNSADFTGRYIYSDSYYYTTSTSDGSAKADKITCNIRFSSQEARQATDNPIQAVLYLHLKDGQITQSYFSSSGYMDETAYQSS